LFLRGGRFSTVCGRHNATILTKFFNLRTPSGSPRCQGSEISDLNVPKSENGWARRNSKILARSVSLFWIGVPDIAQRCFASKAHTAFARLVDLFWIVCAAKVLVSLKQEGDKITREKWRRIPSSRTTRCHWSENRVSVANWCSRCNFDSCDNTWKVVRMISHCLIVDRLGLSRPWNFFHERASGTTCLNPFQWYSGKGFYFIRTCWAVSPKYLVLFCS